MEMLPLWFCSFMQTSINVLAFYRLTKQRGIGSWDHFFNQSRTQSPQALWPAVSRQERLWGHRILLPQDFCGKTMETVTERPIKKFEFFRCPQSLPGVAPLTKKPEDSGYEIVFQSSKRTRVNIDRLILLLVQSKTN